MNKIDIPADLLAGWDIVVIDDEPDSLEVAEIILDAYGATVHTGSNGAEGLKLVREVRPRFIISDISMPVMDGWGFIHELKNDRALMDIPAIALTAHAMVGDRERAIVAGFHNYLTKPLTADTFIYDLLKLLMDIPELAEYLSI
jgi:CheY-like chemotaxis protein